MNGPIKFDHEIRARQIRGYFWMMVFLAVAILFCYVNAARRESVLREQIEQLKAEKTAAQVSLSERDQVINRYTERMASIQSEVAEIERKKADAVRKEEAKKAHAQFVRDEVTCLAENVYREAAYEPENGQLAVATVTMNRVADPFYPKTVCGVVYERHIKKDSDKIVCMFSWTCKPKVVIHPSIYLRVLAMARAVYFKHERNDDVADATLYHASYIKYPNWADPDNLVATIGQHLFYKQ